MVEYKYSAKDLKIALANRLKKHFDLVDAMSLADAAVNEGKAPEALRASMSKNYCDILDNLLVEAQA